MSKVDFSEKARILADELNRSTELPSLIRKYERIRDKFAKYGDNETRINPAFSAYLELKGKTPLYANVTSKQKMVEYTELKMQKFFEDYGDKSLKVKVVDAKGDIKEFKREMTYNDVLDLYKRTKNFKRFKKQIKLLQKNDVQYMFLKKTEYYKR